jgi:hypothetical protein
VLRVQLGNHQKFPYCLTFLITDNIIYVTYEVNCTVANLGKYSEELNNRILEVSVVCHINVEMF